VCYSRFVNISHRGMHYAVFWIRIDPLMLGSKGSGSSFLEFMSMVPNFEYGTEQKKRKKNLVFEWWQSLD
jgi:hypothetical protein